MSKPVIRPILRDSLLAMVKGSVGSTAYRHLFVTIDGRRHDAVRGGKLACAFFASSILHFFKLLKAPHLTVAGTVKDLNACGWKITRTAKPGDVIVWAATMDHAADEPHRHMGFFLGGTRAVSNSSKKRMPAIHHWTFGRKGGNAVREVEMILTPPKQIPRT